jgi:uncharacterized membrane protein YdjX (TVP38/TMEM64 family)
LSHYKLLILILLVAFGIALQLSGCFDPLRLVTAARQYADQPWLIVLLVVVQTILFTIAAPGSSLVWVSAALYPPGASVWIITAGTTLGSITAYMFSAHLSYDWARKIESSNIYRLLQKESGFLTLFAFRLMPGFPHSIINYSSGILKVKFINFIPAAFAGTAIKAYIYSELIYNVTTPGSMTRSIDLATVWPLLVLSLLILIAMLIKHNFES